MDKNKELNSIIILKTIMTLFVVLYHSILALTSSGWAGQIFVYNGVFASFLATWLNTIHIYTFTFASGYLFFMLRQEMGKYKTIKRDIKWRARRLLVPYFYASLCWVAPAQMFFLKIGIFDVIKNFGFAISPGQLWFLPMLFLIYLVFYFTSDFFVNYRYEGFFILVIIYISKVLLERIVPLGIFQISSAMEYLLFFYFGFWYRKEKDHLTDKIPLLVLVVCNIVMVYLYWCVIRNNDYWVISGIIKPFVCFSSVSLVVKISLFISDYRSKLLSVIQENSMGIYLFHQQILYGCTRFLPRNIVPGFVYVIVCFLISLIFSIIISTKIRQSRTGRKILGEYK